MSTLPNLPGMPNLSFWMETNVLDIIPVPVAILDSDLLIIHANKAFTDSFGPWENWNAQTEASCECQPQNGMRTSRRVLDKRTPLAGKGKCATRAGQTLHYTKYSLPILDHEGAASYLLELYIDNTSADILRHEYKSLFDLVPCSIVILDKELRIVDSNRAVRDVYGDLEGRICHKALKGQESLCANCTARRAFITMRAQQDQHVWVAPDGSLMHFQVTALPICDEQGRVTAIMEMGVDITELLRLRDQGEMNTLFLNEIVTHSYRGLAVVSDTGDIPLLNPQMIDLLGLPAIGASSGEELYSLLPEEAIQAIRERQSSFDYRDILLFPERGDDAIPVNLTGKRLSIGGQFQGYLIGIFDLRERKRLEREKREADRMAAVGHTVSGLAHGVKNLVTALEGGMYMLSSGMQGGKAERIAQGMDMLQRNIERIGGFVKSFLSFARSREIMPKMGDPAALAAEVAEQYRVKAQSNNIELNIDVQQGVAPASIDYESLHEALTNLVGNAIDACVMTEEGRKCSITVRFAEEKGVLIYQVSDTGCGMDEQTRKKVFSNFFTTKGENGTGIGLLMTKKLVQQHGGNINLESTLGEGTTFTIRLPRAALPRPKE
jgi:PAS domain S-box-containing protein